MDLQLKKRTTRIERACRRGRTKYLEDSQTPVALVAYIQHTPYAMIGMNDARHEFRELTTWPDAMTLSITHYIVQGLFVQPAFRGHGAVRLLYEAAIEECHRLNGVFTRNWRPDISLKRNTRAGDLVPTGATIWDKLLAEGRAEVLGPTDNPDIPFTIIKRG